MSVKDTNNTDKVLKQLEKLFKKEITIGLQGDVGGDILSRGIYNEFGTKNIPERSFIRAGYDTEKKSIINDAEKLTRKVVAMEIKPNAAANLLGDATKGRIQEFAIDLRDPPNAASTIEQKGSSNPLVDTGQMIGAIDYKVKG